MKKANPLLIKTEQLQRNQATQSHKVNTMLKQVEKMAGQIDSFYEGIEELLESNYHITLQIESVEKRIQQK